MAVARLIFGPAERSMPPSTITVNWPSATMTSGAIWIASEAKLRGVKK